VPLCVHNRHSRARVFKEPVEGGKYIVNGETTNTNEKQPREFYEQNVKRPQSTRLMLSQISGPRSEVGPGAERWWVIRMS